MGQRFKQHWQTVFRGKPGRRFQDRYAEAEKSRTSAGWGQHGRRFLLLFVALASLIVGALLMFLPGPAILFYFFAGTLLAGESLYVARLLDWAEVRLRALWKWGARHWDRMPGWGRAAIITVVVGLTISSTYLSYRLFIR